MKPTQKKFNAGIFFPALLCTLLWGSAFPCVKMGYQLFQISSDATFQKLVFAGWRFSLAGLLVLITARVIGRQNIIPRRGQWGGVIVMALLQTGVQYALFYIAMSHTTGTRGSVITGSAVFFSVIGAHFLFKNDKMTKLKGIGCFIGFAGVILINLNGAGTTEAGVHFMGEGLMLLSAICTGLAAPVCKRPHDDHRMADAARRVHAAGARILRRRFSHHYHPSGNRSLNLYDPAVCRRLLRMEYPAEKIFHQQRGCLQLPGPCLRNAAERNHPG